MQKQLLIFSAIILLITVISIKYLPAKAEIETDSPITWANEAYPINNRSNKYIIEKNKDMLDDKNNVVIPSNIFYFIRPVNQIDDTTWAANLSGRQIGSTSVDLSDYEGKEVYIDGEFYKGEIMFITDLSKIPLELRSRQRIVLDISNLVTEEDVIDQTKTLDCLNSKGLNNPEGC